MDVPNPGEAPYHLEQSRMILQPERNALFTVRLLSGSRRVAERGRDSGCAHEVSESSATASCSVAVARSSSISTFVSISDSESSVFCLSHNAFPHLMPLRLELETLAWECAQERNPREPGAGVLLSPA